MNVVGLAVRSVRQRTLSTVLTAVGVALGVALVVFVSTVRGASRNAFDDAARGYDVVLGGIQTSSLSSVLNAIFHVDQPVDTIPIAALDEVRKDPRVVHAVPTAVGDVYKGYRIVATTPEYFEAIADAQGRPLGERMGKGGRVIGSGAEFEAVLGSLVASRQGLKVGSTLTGVTHGVEQGGHEHHEIWTVVGVLEPTGTPNDRAVFIPLDAFFHMEGHEKPEGLGLPAVLPAGVTAPAMQGPAMQGDDAPKDDDHDHDEHDPKTYAVSSIVVRLKSPALRFQFASDMNQRKDLRAALPSREIGRLFEIVRNVDTLLRAVAGLVLVVGALSILVGLYNTIQGRRREFAILRALGARPGHVFSVIVIEAVLICLLGGVMGLVLGQVGVAVAAPLVLDQVGIRIGSSMVDLPLAGLVLAGLVVLGALAGLLPAWRAFRTPVATNLHPVD